MTLLEKETPPLTPYNFQSDETCTWFKFTTVNGIVYEVTFINNSGLFHNYPAFSQFIYEMSILENSDIAPPFDYAVQLTVSTIVRQFFENNKHVLLFVCDSMDSRHVQRRIKFNRWYEEYADKKELEKHDGYLADMDIEIFSSIILRSDFELKPQILEAFFDINERN